MLMALHPLVVATGGGACTPCGARPRLAPFMGRHRAIPSSAGQRAKHRVPVGGVITATLRLEVQVQDPSLVIHARHDIEASSHATKDHRPAGVATTIVAVNAVLLLVSALSHGCAIHRSTLVHLPIAVERILVCVDRVVGERIRALVLLFMPVYAQTIRMVCNTSHTPRFERSERGTLGPSRATITGTWALLLIPLPRQASRRSRRPLHP